MGKTHVSINEILKHRRCTCNLENAFLKNFSDVKSVFDNALNCSPSVFDKKYDELIRLVTSTTECANRSYHYPLLALEKTDCKTKHVKTYCEEVVPKLDTDSLTRLEDTIDQYNFGDQVKEKIKGVVETNLICDRILNNHNNIIARCDDIENIVLNSMRLGESTVANQIREYVDTYSVRPYQKMNICLEEVFYILEKNSVKYDKSAIVKAIVESFVLAKYDEKKENYIKVLESNYIFNEEDTQAAIDMLSKTDAITGTIQSIIDEYVRVGNIPFLDLCTNIGGCSINDLKLNLPNALDFMWKVVSTGLSYEEMYEGINALFASMANKIATSEDLMTREDLTEICSTIEDYILKVSDYARSDLYTDTQEKLDSYLQALDIGRRQFIQDCSYLYNRNNVDTIYQLNQESGVVTTLQEFKKFRFNNLIKSALNLDKFTRNKSKSLFDKIKMHKPGKKANQSNLKLKGIVFTTPSGASILFGENYTLENYIGSDNKADITVCQFYYDESCELEYKDFFDGVCKEFNQTIKDPNMRAYYIFNPGIGELHLKENVTIQLTEEEKKIVESAEDPGMRIYAESMILFDNMSNKLVDLDDFSDRVVDQKAVITNEQFELLVEALEYLNVPKETVQTFANRYTEYRFRTLVSEGAENLFESEADEIFRIIESYSPIEEFVSPIMKLEAVNIVCDILEAGIKKADIKKADIKKADANNKKHQDYDDEDEDDENYDNEDEDDSDNNDEDKDSDNDEEKDDDEVSPEEKKNIDDMFDPRKGSDKGFGKLINSIRLALKGLRAKIGDLGSKDQEASKNLDASVEHLLKSMHDALISDRREAIIKGSVIPSFSRCIKAGIALVASGGISMVLVGNILPVVIIAIGAFAVSKKLTQRERMLLLDDIETELDVVEKEINMAESKNQMKKYRALLKYKKDLQRQYQRIKYNHRIGKDLMPNSATGVYKPES